MNKHISFKPVTVREVYEMAQKDGWPVSGLCVWCHECQGWHETKILDLSDEKGFKGGSRWWKACAIPYEKKTREVGEVVRTPKGFYAKVIAIDAIYDSVYVEYLNNAKTKKWYPFDELLSVNDDSIDDEPKVMLSVFRFMNILQSNKVIDESAIYAPDEYDNYITYQRVLDAYRDIFKKQEHKKL